jgi:hypothetical protein
MLNTSGEYTVMFGLAYGDDTTRTSCTSQAQNSRQTFSSFKQILKERAAFVLITLEQERQRTVWTHDTESCVMLLNNLGAMQRRPQLQNMLPI